jgi:hypothetical protein
MAVGGNSDALDGVRTRLQYISTWCSTRLRDLTSGKLPRLDVQMARAALERNGQAGGNVAAKSSNAAVPPDSQYISEGQGLCICCMKHWLINV